MKTYPPSQYPIISDPVTMSIRCGNKIYVQPELGRYREMDLRFKSEICPLPRMEMAVKEIHEFYAGTLGPRFNYRFFAANYWLWVGNRMTVRTGNMLRHDRRYWKSYDNSLVAVAHNILPYIQSCERDGLYNLIPPMLTFKTGCQGVRALIGDKAWDRVCANSVSRNLLLMHAYKRLRGIQHPNYYVALLDVPSGVLPAISEIDEAAIIAARMTPRKTKDSFRIANALVSEAIFYLGDKFNPNWDYSVMRMALLLNSEPQDVARKTVTYPKERDMK